MKDLSPIPAGPGVDGWQRIPIEENHEQLVSLNRLTHRMIVRPYYYAMNIPTAIDGAYVRQGAI
ncbi:MULTISPECIES: hypothetical protein [Paenibacillus]|uniref:Uncharacterized protein n=1 Tax=Paenibacillus naphthalenovorans TaxID=162209 RepID=A0A0U2U2E7_9BACL|nr:MULTISPECIES: hypothetical protein [Paenibacillus]ALS20488.1 hypothetical protein IJ22_00960 [Paenibacillus naphthalenovorans]